MRSPLVPYRKVSRTSSDEVLPRRLHVDLPLLGDRLRHLLVVVGRAGGPRQDRPLAERQRRVRHDQLRVDLHLRAEAGAARAGAVRGVEREHPRLQLGHRGAAVQAREALGVGGEPPGSSPAPSCSTSTMPSASATAVSIESASRLRRSGRMTSRSTTTEMSCLYFLSSVDVLLEPAQLAVDLDPREALGAQLLEQLAVLALAAPDHGRQHHELLALVERHHLVDDLLGRLGRDRPAAVVAVRVADPGPQQPQVVVDLGDGADRGARVARGGLLVDRDGRRQALDRVHVGLVHLAQELARVGRQRLDVAALALGVDRVEGKAGLAGARQPGDHDQGVARQPEVEILQVVLAGARDDELVLASHKRVYAAVRSERLFARARLRYLRGRRERRGARFSARRASRPRRASRRGRRGRSCPSR